MGMTETYVPQPGTIQARGIAHLKALGAATSVPNALLAEELDVDAVDLAKAMHTAFERGAVSREIRDRQPWWGVGHPKVRPLGALLPVTADEDDVDDFPIVQRVVSATQETTMNKPVTPPPDQEAARRARRIRSGVLRAEATPAAAGDHRRRLALPGAARAHEAGRLDRRGARDRQGARVGRQEGEGEAGHARAQRDGHWRLAALT